MRGEPRPNVHDLRVLIETIGRERTERELGVHRTTVKRWLDGSVKLPAAVHAHIRALLGHLPGTDGQWEGWRFWQGRLYCREWREGFTADEVVGIPHLHQRIAQLERFLSEANAKIADLVRERAVRDVAANDAAEVRPGVRSR